MSSDSPAATVEPGWPRKVIDVVVANQWLAAVDVKDLCFERDVRTRHLFVELGRYRDRRRGSDLRRCFGLRLI
jgi:hypothetical protein